MGFDANGEFTMPSREELTGRLSLLKMDLDKILGAENYAVEYDNLAKRVVVNERNVELDPNTRARIERIESELQDCKDLFLGK
ncbi:MAG: hypothetical protein WCT40_00425 [Candidatus Magasanikbacteria bacterium]|jgi:hypothetical protein